MDVVSSFGVAEPNKAPNRYIKRLQKQHGEFFNIEFDELSKLKRIASGAFGTVYRTKYKGEFVAAKRIETNGDSNTYKYLLREIINLQKMNHDNVLKYIGLTHDQQKEVYMITDLVEGGSLAKMIKKIRKDNPNIIRITCKVAFGMRYMNSLNMLHRDLKLGNVLVSNDFNIVKLCDFGLSVVPDDDVQVGKKLRPPVMQRKMTCVGTGNYMAPEMKTGEGNYASDVYSFGVMLAMLLGYPTKMQKKKFDPELFKRKKDKTVPNELEVLVLQCTREDPSRRPTFSSIASGLVQIHNQKYKDEPPMLDEESSIAMDVATCTLKARRSSSATRQPQRGHSLEIQSAPVSPVVSGRGRGVVVLEKPNFDLIPTKVEEEREKNDRPFATTT